MRATLLAPTFVAIAFITIVPVGFTLYASLTDWHLFAYGVPIHFVGLNNFAKLFQDKNFTIAVQNTALFATAGPVVQYLIGLVVALALNNATRGRRFFRTLFWLPMMIGSVAVTLIVGRMMLDPYVGPVNTVVRWMGLEPIPWLADRTIAKLSLIVIDTWRATPFIIMILLAGLQSIPVDLYEAAMVDGASGWHIFYRITFPLLAPVSATVFLIRVVDAWQIFDIINVLTGGGPGRATQSITYLVYQLGVRGGNISYACTQAWALMFVLIVVAGIIFSATRRFVW